MRHRDSELLEKDVGEKKVLGTSLNLVGKAADALASDPFYEFGRLLTHF